jgi:hypothetical protein
MKDLTELTSMLPTGILDNLSRVVGESPVTTARALKTVVPATGYVISDYGSSETGARSLLDGLSNNRYQTVDAEGLGRSLTDPEGARRLMDSGSGFLQGILGNRGSGIVDALSSHSGVGSGAVSKLMALAAPLALGMISRHARENNLDAAGLSSFLGQQKSRLGQLLPGGIGNLLGAAPSPSRGLVTQGHAPTRPGTRWGWAIAAAVALIVAIGLLGRGNRRERVQGRTPTPVTVRTRAGDPALKDRLNAYFSSADPSRHFTIRDDDADVKELSDAMAAHPDASLVINAISSKPGGEAALRRANDVKDQLVKSGVPAPRIQTGTRVESGSDRLEATLTR